MDMNTDHDEEDVPDKEARSSRGSAGRGEGRVLVFGVSVFLGRQSFPRLDVAVQFPLLLVDERLHVDARYLAAVLLQIKFVLGPFRCDRQRQVLQHRRIFRLLTTNRERFVIRYHHQ